MLPSVHTFEHQGIPTYWADLPGTCTGTLTFGVGTRDEPVTLAGITHLVEHVVLRTIEPITMRHNGSTDEDSLSFYASGDPDAVADFLNTVASAITRIDAVSSELLEIEKKVLAAELTVEYRRPTSGLSTYRYGSQDIGVSQMGAPATTAITREEVVEWVREWLVASNAALTWTTAPSGSLNLTLPNGTIVRSQAPSQRAKTPNLTCSTKGGIAVSLVTPRPHGRLLADAMAFDLLQQLRHERGLIYDVDVLTTIVTTDSLQIDLILDPTDDTLAEALERTVEIVRDFAANGFSKAAIVAVQQDTAASLGWESHRMAAYLDELSVDRLRGRLTPSPQDQLEAANSMTSDLLKQALSQALPSLIVAVDESVELPPEVVPRLDLLFDAFQPWEAHPKLRGGTSWKGKWRGDASGSLLVITDHHLILRTGQVRSIALANIAVAGHHGCGCWSIIDHRGRLAEIDPDDWRDGDSMGRELLERIPGQLIRDFPSH
ncbi:hypothetical protein BH09ACT10_BH09ACT10_17620 [soil metagenome]